MRMARHRRKPSRLQQDHLATGRIPQTGHRTPIQLRITAMVHLPAAWLLRQRLMPRISSRQRMHSPEPDIPLTDGMKKQMALALRGHLRARVSQNLARSGNGRIPITSLCLLNGRQINIPYRSAPMEEQAQFQVLLRRMIPLFQASRTA